MARVVWMMSVLAVVAISCCCLIQAVDSKSICSYPAVYAFGDSIAENGNTIASFPAQFGNVEKNPYGTTWPGHGADRWCDGKNFIDYLSFSLGLGPTYPWLRSIATSPQWGTNFAVAGATAVNWTDYWYPKTGYQTPYSLNYQLQWLRRYKVRLQLYYNQTYVTQELPAYSTLNTSMYAVQAGFQDYFYPLFYETTTASKLLGQVESVVSAIGDFIQGLVDFGAKEILVGNLLPLGCTPALLTLYPGKPDKYNHFGCLSELNQISVSHNRKLEAKVVAFRAKYPSITFYLGDFYGVYNAVLSSPSTYNITETLKACCGAGGYYNFNKEVMCTEIGTVGKNTYNLTTPCDNPGGYVNWDGIHPSHTVNKAAINNFFAGKYITPSFSCTANTTQLT